MKRFIACYLACLVLLFSLAACSIRHQKVENRVNRGLQNASESILLTVRLNETAAQSGLIDEEKRLSNEQRIVELAKAYNLAHDRADAEAINAVLDELALIRDTLKGVKRE
jgi:hypothetical protein